MFEIHVTVSCPDLLAAAQLLKGIAADAHAIEKAPVPANITPAPFVCPTSVANAPMIGQSAAPTSTLAPVAQTVPLAAAPTFTLDQICKAGADLVTQNPGILPQVNGLLGQYGVQAVSDLKPEHFGAVATALRGLGAKI